MLQRRSTTRDQEVSSPAPREMHRAKCAKEESKAGTWLLLLKDLSPKWARNHWGKKCEAGPREGPAQLVQSRASGSGLRKNARYGVRPLSPVISSTFRKSTGAFGGGPKDRGGCFRWTRHRAFFEIDVDSGVFQVSMLCFAAPARNLLTASTIHPTCIVLPEDLAVKEASAATCERSSEMPECERAQGIAPYGSPCSSPSIVMIIR